MTELHRTHLEHMLWELVHLAMEHGDEHWPRWAYTLDDHEAGGLELTMTWNPLGPEGEPLEPRRDVPLVYHVRPNPTWAADDYDAQWEFAEVTRERAWSSHQKTTYDGGDDWPYLAVPYTEGLNQAHGLIELVRHDTAHYQRQLEAEAEPVTVPDPEPGEPAPGTLFG